VSLLAFTRVLRIRRLFMLQDKLEKTVHPALGTDTFSFFLFHKQKEARSFGARRLV
jgi:hypothetical protein